MSAIDTTGWGAGGAGSPVHTVFFYDDSAFPAEVVADFLMGAVEAGGSVVTLATEEHERALEERLADRGVAPEMLARSGHLIRQDATDALHLFMTGSQPDCGRFVELVGHLLDMAIANAGPEHRVHVYGECVAILARQQNLEAALRIERLWNELLALRSFSLCCAYPAHLFVAANGAQDPLLGIYGVHDGALSSPGSAPALVACQGCAHARCIAVLEQQARCLEYLSHERATARAQLSEAERRKDDFIALLGHELRNPLAPIATALDMMDLRGDRSSERERAIMRRQVGHLRRLVDDLLDVARIRTGKLDLHLETVELESLVVQAVEQASPILERRKHHLTLDVPESGLPVHVDPFRCGQILGNLLTNAGSYTNPGGHILIRAHREGTTVVTEVTDNGQGLSSEMIDRIFEPFSQGERTLDRAAGGLGLGLALARTLAELHQGKLTACSAGPDRGSTFRLELPIAENVIPLPDGRSTSTAHPARTVLVVDDNRDAADLIATVLEAANYTVVVAYDGPSALAAAQATPPDIGVLDIGLPVMDGYELAATLRARLAGVRPLRLIAVSGYGQVTDRVKSCAAGFDLHLVKPVDLTQLIDAVEGSSQTQFEAPRALLRKAC